MRPKLSRRLFLKELRLKYALLGLSLIFIVSFGFVANPYSLALSPSSSWQVGLGENLPNASKLQQQGRELYEAGQFFEAARIWQLAAQAFQTQGDTLSQAQVLNYTSLAYQQLGQ